MIRTFAVTNDLKLINDIPLNRLSDFDIKWFWVDFNVPTDEEAMLLKTHFKLPSTSD